MEAMDLFYSKSKGNGRFQYNQGQGYSNLNLSCISILLEFWEIHLNFTLEYPHLQSLANCVLNKDTVAKCVYRNTGSSKPCQICNRINHSAVTCLYRKRNYTPPPHMTAMHSSFPGENQMYAMPSHMSTVLPPSIPSHVSNAMSSSMSASWHHLIH